MCVCVLVAIMWTEMLVAARSRECGLRLTCDFCCAFLYMPRANECIRTSTHDRSCKPLYMRATSAWNMTSDCIGFFLVACILYTCDCIYIGVCISRGIVCASRQKSVRSSDSSAHNHNTLAETHSQALIHTRAHTHTQYLAFDYYATSVPVQFHQRVPRRWAFSSRTQNVLCSSAHTPIVIHIRVYTPQTRWKIHHAARSHTLSIPLHRVCMEIHFST